MTVPGFVGGAPAGLAYYPADFWLVLGLVFAVVEGSYSIPRGPLRPLFGLGLLWIIAGIPSLFVATWPVAAFQQWSALPRALLACLLVCSQAKTEDSRQFFIGALLVGLLFQSGVAVAQHIRGTVLGLSWLGEPPAEHLAKAIAPGIILWRSGGTMAHPNILATFLLGLLPLCVGTVVRQETTRAVRVAALAILAMGLAAFVWTYSRGAWASLAIVGIYFLFVGVRRVLRSGIIIPVALLGLGVFIVAFPTIRHRLTRTEPSATDVRLALVPVSLRMAESYPLSGVGLNHFADRLESYDPAMELELFRHPVHNIVLLDLAEAGILAGIVSLLLWGIVVFTAAVNIRQAAMHHRPLAAAIWAGAGLMVLHNVADWTLRRPEILLLFWVLIALGSAETSGSRRA
jgi:O-antigen ligase